jgi:hypothetical protein
MKLKRLLLRYDPPGVGLEIEAGGDTNVVHKDMPSATEVNTIADIHSLVDALIEEEHRLLTKKKHSAALVQLLGRLFQIDVEEADGKVEVTKEKHSARGASSAEPEGLKEGNQVVIVGLKAKQQEHNGEVGVLIKAKADKGKYEVMLKTGDQESAITIKGAEHVIPVARVSLAVGVLVSIGGLRNHLELNGMFGRIESCQLEVNRFEVRALESGQLFRVKKENIVPIEEGYIQRIVPKENQDPNAATTAYQGNSNVDGPGDKLGCKAGQKVTLHGLKAAQCYNGQEAVVLSVDKARDRYEIKLRDGSVKTIRAENVLAQKE